MTKIYKAIPVKRAEPERRGGKPYLLSPEALTIRTFDVMEESPVASAMEKGGAPYLTNLSSSFGLEINILDSKSQLPLRAVEIVSGLVKGVTNRLGRLILRLPAGHNSVSIDGMGYIEDGKFTPKKVEFDPVVLEIDLDCDEIVTLYSSGEIIKGERHELGNPGHGPINIQKFIEENWQILALASGGALGAYLLGRRKKD